MLRQIVGYVPSTVIPAAVSFVMIYVYTRLLTPAEYGSFSLVFSFILVAQTSLFFAIPMALTRFYPQALAQNRRETFLSACYTLFYGLSSLIVLSIGIVSLFVPVAHPGLWVLTTLVLIARAAVVVNQSVNRISFKMGRFNTIECAHAVLGLGLGTAFIFWLGASAEAIVLGLLVASLLCVSADVGLLLTPFRVGWAKIERATLVELIRFSLPLILVDITICLLTLSDRFLLETLAGAEALGLYTVAYNLVERPTALVCSAITTATFPATVQVLHDRGSLAGSFQAGTNASMLLTLVIPACVGLALTAPYMAAVMIGADFRPGVAALIPILCVVALFRVVSFHIIDHAFLLGGRTSLAIWAYGPAALANIALNIVLIPRYGMFGAAWAGLLCQGTAVIVGWGLSLRTFPIRLPLIDVVKIVAAGFPMAVLLNVVTFTSTLAGLFQAIVSGALVFAAASAALDVGGFRTAAWKRLPERVTASRRADVS